MGDLLARRLRRQVQKVGKTCRNQEDERNRCEQEVEGDSPRKEENVVVGAVVPDAPGIIAERPAKALECPALPAAPRPRAAVRYSSVVDPLLELPEVW